MWNQGNDGAGYNGNTTGGGFMNSQNTDSPGLGTQDKKRRIQNVVPVSIGQINNSGEEVMVAGQEVNMVSIVGLVVEVEQVTTKINFTIEDSTGTINAVKWLEGDETDVGMSPNSMVNTYVNVIGTSRTQQGKKHLMIFKISQLPTLNHLTQHILQVIHTPLKLEAVSKQQFDKTGNVGGTAAAGGAGAGGNDTSINNGVNDNSMVNGGGIMDSLNPQQKLVYSAIRSCHDDAGIHKADVVNSLRGKMSSKQVDAAIDFLANEGNIYSTIDEDHFKSTDE